VAGGAQEKRRSVLHEHSTLCRILKIIIVEASKLCDPGLLSIYSRIVLIRSELLNLFFSSQEISVIRQQPYPLIFWSCDS